jgi:hypothetical protein
MNSIIARGGPTYRPEVAAAHPQVLKLSGVFYTPSGLIYKKYKKIKSKSNF